MAPCDTVQLEAVDLGILGLGRALARLEDENAALRQTGALDLEAERGKTAAAETKLASPWRNPWIMIPVALVIGFGIGWGLAFSQ